MARVYIEQDRTSQIESALQRAKVAHTTTGSRVRRKHGVHGA